MRWLAVGFLFALSCYTQASAPRPAPPGAVVEPPRSTQIHDGDHRLEATYTSTCWIDDADDLWCWGSVDVGRMQPPTRMGIKARYVTASDEPYAKPCVIDLDAVASCAGERVPSAVDVGAGTGFACALNEAGTVRCWGGNIDPSHAPRDARQLSVGDSHACAVLKNRTVICWGHNHLGQLGVRPHPGHTAQRPQPVALDNVAGVSAGTALSCAWKLDGTVWCWGSRAFGGLGSLATSNHEAHPDPVQVKGLSNIVQVAVGGNFAVCALDRSGRAFCWGHNYQGIFGADADVGSIGPVMVELEEPVAEIRVAGAHACARLVAGPVKCWGWNEFGQLGHAEGGVTWHPTEVALGRPPATQPPQPATAAVVSRTPKGATRVEIKLDSATSLTDAGWERVPGGQSTFSGGMLHIEARGFEEWALRPNDAIANPFIGEAGNPPGWAVEATLQLDTPCAKHGTGFWIHDGFHYVSPRISDHEIVVGSLVKNIGPTTKPRTIRIEQTNDILTVVVDGNVVGTTPAIEGHATHTLMFGVLGDGCGRDKSTWHSIAYETFAAPPRTWPTRHEWHPGTTAQQIIDVLPAWARTAAKGKDAACIAMAALDSGGRDLLAIGYRDLKSDATAKRFEQAALLTSRAAIRQVRQQLAYLMTPKQYPICTPPPGGQCGPPQTPATPEPVPAVAPAIARALDDAQRWAIHPKLATRAVKSVSDAYAQAAAAKTPGIAAAQARLVARMKGLTTAPHCGLLKPGTRVVREPPDDPGYGEDD